MGGCASQVNLLFEADSGEGDCGSKMGRKRTPLGIINMPSIWYSLCQIYFMEPIRSDE
jgi:hypothetical protein